MTTPYENLLIAVVEQAVFDVRENELVQRDEPVQPSLWPELWVEMSSASQWVWHGGLEMCLKYIECGHLTGEILGRLRVEMNGPLDKSASL